MLPHAEKLIDKAQRGERLTNSERKHCISFLMATRPEVTNVTMAELFMVSERQIRKDKQRIKEDKVATIKEDDIGMVIADIAMTVERQKHDLEASKRKARLGTKNFVEHCKAILDVQLKAVKALQELGYYPKNLGNVTIDKFEFVATTSKDGAVSTRPVNLFDAEDVEIIEAQVESSAPAQIAAPAQTLHNDLTPATEQVEILAEDSSPVGVGPEVGVGRLGMDGEERAGRLQQVQPGD